jgi:hypothetical protein
MIEQIMTTFIPSEASTHSLRRVIEITETPLNVVRGRNVVRRVEKILMPNGRYRYPVTYIDRTPGGWPASIVEETERIARETDHYVHRP